MADSSARTKRRNAVFIEDFVELPFPVTAIRERFIAGASWLAPLANAAEQDGESVRLSIGPEWLGGRVTREVLVQLLGVRRRGDAIVVSLSWQPTKRPALFPVLEGDLELAPIGTGLSRLTLSASYSPPLGEFGRSLDMAMLHRVGQSTVRSFLRRIAYSLSEGPGAFRYRPLEPLVECREGRPREALAGGVMHLVRAGEELALCGYRRSLSDSIDPYISSLELHCEACWQALA